MDFRYKVLVVEDDQSMRHYIISVLGLEGYDCIGADNGIDAVVFARSHCPDIILLDMGLPDGTGLKVLKELRDWCSIPVIVVSSWDTEQDKVMALEYGADDYVLKPFGLNELLARIRAAIRRTASANPERSNNRCLTVCGLTIDYGKCRVSVRGRDTDLTQSEFRIVSLLGEKLGSVVTYDEIITRIWGPNAHNGNQILRVNIANIRRKICDTPTEPQYIKTVTGRGYMLADGGEEQT